MARLRIDIMDLKQLIQLKIDGLSNRACAEVTGIHRNTINHYVNQMKGSLYSLSDLLKMENSDLRELFPQSEGVKSVRYTTLVNYLTEVHAERIETGFTFWNKWNSYIHRFPDGYSYTQFMFHYHRLYPKDAGGSMRLNHKVGERMMVDYTGQKLHIVDKQTGERQEVEIFISILAASQYTYVEASASQKKEDFIQSMNRCLDFFGGVPQAITCDNLKSAVSKSSKYEPIINKTFKDFGLHYGTVIHPTRPYKPKDKALVENAVKLVYQRIVFNLKDMIFFSIEDLNQEISKWLDIHNRTHFQNRDYSRFDQFIKYEQKALKPLPGQWYHIKQYHWAKVQKNGHVYYSPDKHYYSVPHRYIGKRTEIQSTEYSVEVYVHGRRIAIHKREPSKGLYTTRQEHLSSSHQYYAGWSESFFVQRAQGIGPYCQEYIRSLIRSKDFPEQGYKQAQGILHLKRQYDKQRIEQACQLGIELKKYSYRHLEQILKSGSDKLIIRTLPDKNYTHIPKHENIRGARNYY